MKLFQLIFTLAIIIWTISLQAQQDLKLWYSQPAEKWTDALPIGNGRLGAMIFGTVEKERIQFNEETLWTGEPRNHHRDGASKYLPQIRQLLFEGKQKEAEKLAEETFMGLRSDEGKRDEWFNAMRSLKGMNGNPALPDYNDKDWKTVLVPAYEGWETTGFEGLDGAVWFRTTFDAPADWQGKNLILDLNRIRDHDFTYVNGKLVGTMNGTDPRKYTVPKDAWKAGENTIAIQVLNYFDKGGIAGYKDTSRHIRIYPENTPTANGISLVKKWKYKIQHDEPPAVPRYQADYQPFGDLWIDFKDHQTYKNYHRELDLQNAIAKTTYTVNGIQYTREYFSSHPHNVHAIKLSADKKGSVSFNAVLNSPHKNFLTQKIDNNTLALSVRVRNGALHGVSYLRILNKGGNIRIAGDKITVEQADEVILYLAAATNYKNYKDVSGDPVATCKTVMRTLDKTDYEKVKAAHVKEYQSYFNTLSINLGKSKNQTLATDQRIQRFASDRDPSFAALYLQYGRYLLIASSRPGTRPANLQGIWNDLLTPPWGSKYTTNINAEMNYWPAEPLNLSPLHEPLFNMIEELSVVGRKTAKAHYNASGWVLHHNTDLWRGTAPINASNHGIWVTGGAWLCHHLWQRYQFTKDKSFLEKRAYPIMKEAALFFSDFLVKDPKTGWLISTPSNSPETGGLVAGPAMDHQIIRDLFNNCIQASEILNTDMDLRRALREKYLQIAPNQIGKFGQLQEWLEDKDDTSNKHRHVSHLWGVHPGSDINWDKNPDLMKAARQSLIYRGDAGTGWSLAWKINFWSRFKDGDHAFKMIKMLISPAAKGGGSYVNLFDAHPPFQIDGNFGGAAGIGEMLVQSHAGYIDLLPALPSDFKEGEIKGFCARGGFEVDMTWKNNQLQQVEILSKAGDDCIVRYGNKEVRFKTQKGKRYKLNGQLQLSE
jgi:alpha-L-fucosidase 2